jgi:hypothetical protein
MDRRITEDKGAWSGFDGFLLSVEKGRALGGIRNVEATEILRRNGSADYKEQEKILIEYAKERGCWFSICDIKLNWKFLPYSGAESVVYSDKDGKYVLKVMSYFMSDSPLEFLNSRITMHNALFPENAYELTGFCYDTREEGEEFCFITKQLFIEGEEPTQQEIDRYMEWRGFQKSNKIGSYISDMYKVTDLLPNNFIKDDYLGRLHCIDSMIYLRQKYPL